MILFFINEVQANNKMYTLIYIFFYYRNYLLIVFQNVTSNNVQTIKTCNYLELEILLYFSVQMTCCFAMRHRSIGIIFGSLFVWGIITYFLFLNQPNSKDQDKVIINYFSKLRS